MKVESAAGRFARKLKGQVNYENVANYITEKGYTIILFDDNTEEIHIYGLAKLASERIAFTYIDNVKLIFIRRSCIEYQKLQLLLHEIAHIELNHFDFHASNSDEKEYQANRFAELVTGRRERFQRIAVCVAAVSVAVAVITVVLALLL